MIESLVGAADVRAKGRMRPAGRMFDMPGLRSLHAHEADRERLLKRFVSIEV
jgi:hypothetical protein